MSARRTGLVSGVGLGLSLWLAGCGPLQLTDFLAPELFTAMGLGWQVASLPGDAPGLLVELENRTDRWASMVVTYRDATDTVQTFTSVVAPGEKTGQMLACPVSEITLGDVSNLSQPGARIYLIDDVGADTRVLGSAPYIEVDAFGVLLLDQVNYNCGDGLRFTVERSAQARSGFRTFAYIRRASKQ